MRRRLTFLLLVAAPIAGWGWGEREQGLWRLLQPPRFRTLQGTLQVSVFSERMGDRVWTINLWADERNSRTQLMLPHPEGARQIITITTPEGMWVFLPFAKRAIRQVGMHFPSWRDLWGFRSDKLDFSPAQLRPSVCRSGESRRFALLGRGVSPQIQGEPQASFVDSPAHPPAVADGALRPRWCPAGAHRFHRGAIGRPLPLLIFDTTLPQDWQLMEVSAQRQPINVADAMRVLGFPLLLPTWVPPGYVLDGVFALQDRQWKVAHIVYTDGISVISLFEHPVPKERPRERRPFRPEREGQHSQLGREAPRMGPPPMVRMFPQQWVRRDIGGLRVVLVGETSREWLERIVESLASQIASDR